MEDIIINIDVQDNNAAKSIDEVSKSLEDNAKAADDSAAGVDDYNKSLIESIKETKFFGVSINGLTKSLSASFNAIKGVNIGLKAFKVALIATGVGAIVVALGSLVAVLTKTQTGMDFVTKATNAMSTVIDVVIDRFIGFGNGLIKFFKGDFA